MFVVKNGSKMVQMGVLRSGTPFLALLAVDICQIGWLAHLLPDRVSQNSREVVSALVDGAEEPPAETTQLRSGRLRFLLQSCVLLT